MSRKSTTNRWAVIYNWGEIVYLAADYETKEEVAQNILTVRSKMAFAVRVPSYCHHPYADAQTRETEEVESPEPPKNPMEVFDHLRPTGRGV